MKLHKQIGFVIIYAFLTVLIPWFGIFATFAPRDGWLFIGFYSHLFLFPLLFGIIQFFMLLKLAHVLASLPPTRLFIRYGIFLSLVAAILFCVVEFGESPAVFELNPRIVNSPISKDGSATYLDHLRKPTDASKAAFSKNIPDNSWFFFTPRASLAKYAYAIDFAVQTFIWVWVVLLFFWSARLAFVRDPDYIKFRNVVIPLMLWILILSLPWFAMRVAFEGYRSELYASLQIERPSVMLAILFILATLYLTAVTWKILGDKLNSAIGLISGLGVTGLCFKGQWLNALFPRNPSVNHYLFMWLIIIVCLFCFVVPYRQREKSSQPLRPSEFQRD